MSRIAFSTMRIAAVMLLGLANTVVFADQLSSYSTGGGIVSSVTFPATDTSCSTTPTGATIIPLGVCQVHNVEFCFD